MTWHMKLYLLNIDMYIESFRDSVLYRISVVHWEDNLKIKRTLEIIFGLSLSQRADIQKQLPVTSTSWCTFALPHFASWLALVWFHILNLVWQLVNLICYKYKEVIICLSYDFIISVNLIGQLKMRLTRDFLF